MNYLPAQLPVVVIVTGVTKQKMRTGAGKTAQEIMGVDNFDFIEYSPAKHFHAHQVETYEEYKKEKGRFTRKTGLASIMVVSDIALYNRHRDIVIKDLEKVLTPYKGREIILIAHSMGAALAVDFMEAHAEFNIKKLFTFGLNIKLFRMDKPILNRLEMWHNWSEKNDFLGWSNKSGVPKTVVQHEFKAKNPFKKYFWWVHLQYWKSPKIFKYIKEMCL